MFKVRLTDDVFFKYVNVLYLKTRFSGLYLTLVLTHNVLGG